MNFQPVYLTAGYFNGDGKADLVVVAELFWINTLHQLGTFEAVVALLGNGDGSFQPAQKFNLATTPTWLAVGEFNRDTLPDLVVGNNSANTISVLLNTTPWARNDQLWLWTLALWPLMPSPPDPGYKGPSASSEHYISKIYVANSGRDKVAVIDGSTWLSRLPWHTGFQLCQIEEIATVDWQIFDLLLIEHTLHGGLLRVYAHFRALDLDNLGLLPELQGPSFEGSELSVSARPTDLGLYFGGNGTRVSQENVFTLKDVTDGTYIADVDGQSKDCYIKDVQYGGSSALEEGFTVTRGTPASLEITIRFVAIRGTMTLNTICFSVWEFVYRCKWRRSPKSPTLRPLSKR